MDIVILSLALCVVGFLIIVLSEWHDYRKWKSSFIPVRDCWYAGTCPALEGRQCAADCRWRNGQKW